MSLTGDTFDFQQGNVVTSSAQIVDPAATVGDVLTVQADKSIAAAPGGGSLPDPITDPVHIAVDSDVVGLTVTAPVAGSANLLEAIPEDPTRTLAIDVNGRFHQASFSFITSETAGGFGVDLATAANFVVDSDNTGDYAIKVTEAADIKLGFFNAAPVVQSDVPAGLQALEGIAGALADLGLITTSGTPIATPEVPFAATVEDVVDALKVLGLITQAGA